jgi:phosphoesterase RecJ-like protein
MARSAQAQIRASLESPGLKLLTGHVRPDGDALGATLGLARCLRLQGREVVVAAETADMGPVTFLEGCGTVSRPADAALHNVSGMVCLDCGTLQRLPEPLQALAARVPVINIDHHRTNTRFGQINWIEPSASSTSELVWQLARYARWPLDRAIAEALWVGLVTDTGRFAHDQTSPRTLRCAANLLRQGVRTAWINDRLFGSFDRKVLELKRRAYSALDVWMDGRVAAVTLTREDFAAAGCSKADAEDIIEIPRSLRGSLVALFFYEAGEEHVTRLSIRTREPLDATRLALRFAGGGHARAAGCTIHAPMDEAKKQVRALLPEVFFSESRTPSLPDFVLSK